MGKKQERFKLLQKLDDSVEYGRTQEAIGQIKMLVKMSLPDLSEKADELRRFEKEKEEERKREIKRINEEAKNKNTLHKREKFKRTGYLKARRDYIVPMWEKLWNIFTEKRLIPE